MTLRGASLFAAKVLAIVASSGAIVLVSFYISIRAMIFGNEVQVPDLRGKSVEQSEELLRGAGLYLEKKIERFDPRVPEGEVISQSPAPGANIKTKRKVKVVMSLGTEVLTVPDLGGETERRALLEIDRLGLRRGGVSRVRTPAAADRVVSQDPIPDTEIFRGERISLMVSQGPPDAVFVMPDLAGQRMDRVQRRLEEQGFRLAGTTYERSSAPDGTVLSQFPLPGYPVTRRDTITVVVSRGSSA